MSQAQPRAEFACKICGAFAGALWIDANDQLCVEGWGNTTYGSGWQRVDRASLARLIAARDARAIHALDALLMPFYCPQCNAAFCNAHWAREMMFDDDFPGWYDCTYGTCPAGHRRMIDD